MNDAPNAGQVAYWNDATGHVWAEAQADLDRQLAPLGRRAMAALEPHPGERILDIGCGAGETSLELAQAVGPEGSVMGVDISRPLLEVGRRRAHGVANLHFVEADAQTYPFEHQSFDAAFSRFGVMFFADPPAAFANVRKALKPGGRLAFVCWRGIAENPIMSFAMAAAAPHLPALPPPPEPGAPGPFAFADPDHVRRILAEAGFGTVAITPHDEKVGAGDLETMLGLTMKIGPLGSILRADPSLREAVREPVRQALAAHDGPGGVRLDSATWIVTATAP